MQLTVVLAHVAILGATAMAFPAASIEFFPRGEPVKGAELDYLRARHANVTANMDALQPIPVYGPQEGLEKRVPPVIGFIAGLYLALAGRATGELTKAIGKQMEKVFWGRNTAPWNDSDNCVVEFSTHGGGECKATVWAAARTGHKGKYFHAADEGPKDWPNCAWVNPSDDNPPPVQFFNDAGLGKYSFQMTATKEKTFSGNGNKGRKCVGEGLCHPQIIFYRDDFDLVLNTWESQGDLSAGGYTGDYKGLCGGGPVKDQFKKGGLVMGFDCAVPCADDGALPSTKDD